MENIFKETFKRLIERVKSGKIPKKETLCTIENSSINNKIIYSANTGSIIVIDNERNKFEGVLPNISDINTLKTATTEQIISILTPKTQVETEDSEKVEIVSNFLPIFEDSEDFDVIDGKLYFKDIKTIEIPVLIVGRFIELLENIKKYSIELTSCCKELQDNLNEYESLKMFTYWLLLNPIESARKDALNFIEKNNLPITDNGMLVTFRKVVSTGQKDKELVEFISNSYFKIKGQKKSPLNYNVYKNSEANLVLHNINNKNIDFVIDYGNLSDLYKNLPNMVENTFTDNHTRTKLIKIGEVYKEDEDKINLDNTEACGAGLKCSPLIK